MRIEDFFKTIKDNKNDFFQKLDESIKKNNIETTNEDFPFINNMYANILQNMTNESIKSTTGKLNIKEHK